MDYCRERVSLYSAFVNSAFKLESDPCWGSLTAPGSSYLELEKPVTNICLSVSNDSRPI